MGSLDKSKGRTNIRYSLVFLQVEEGDAVAVAGEGVLGDDRDVVGSQVQVSETVQTPQCITGDLVEVVVAKSQVLEVFFKNKLVSTNFIMKY